MASLHLDSVLKAARKKLVYLEEHPESHRRRLELHALPVPPLSGQRPQPELFSIRVMAAPIAQSLGSWDRLASMAVVGMRQPLFLLGTHTQIFRVTRALMSCDLRSDWQLYLRQLT